MVIWFGFCFCFLKEDLKNTKLLLTECPKAILNNYFLTKKIEQLLQGD